MAVVAGAVLQRSEGAVYITHGITGEVVQPTSPVVCVASVTRAAGPAPQVGTGAWQSGRA